ncbi:MAG: ATP-dependent Clp protease proteolytic subunit [Bacteroidia bacterium]|nr:ATP-dependent Clp protease proteolytic subunit [Bacteroidia bacterium]MDW8157892.1 ATP-dependent Clp protease proteolytic subunit [Bacteroidia bacterium]
MNLIDAILNTTNNLCQNSLGDPLSLLWLFFIFLSLQPVIRQRLIESLRQRLINKIEKERNSRVILIVHRQESMSLLGFPILKYISMEDSEEVLRALEATEPEKDIDLVLHTPGGLVLASLQIARAIQNRKGKVRVIIPHYAMSGGTLIALAADEIIMSPNAVLGPVDPQLGEYPAAALKNLLTKKDINEIEDKTLIYADIAEKAISQMQDAVYEILSKNYPEEKARELSHLLTEGKWTHDYPITASKATELGINVQTDMPKIFMELMSLYKQPLLQRTKTVDYLQERAF